MDTAAQWPQGIINGVVMQKHVEAPSANPSALVEKRAPNEQPLNCPRCNSCNTKFCYYNNYSLTQPRYFCKTCRRYWTQGGTLRSVPVGGGSRKNKRHSSDSSSSSSSSLSKKQVMTLPPPPLNLINDESYFRSQNPNFASSELSLGSYVPALSADYTNNVNMFSSLFPFQEFKPTLNYFAFDNHHHGLVTRGNGVHQETTMAKVDGFDQINQGQGNRDDSIGLLNNGMLSGGVWQL